jgi:hypothetical protein
MKALSTHARPASRAVNGPVFLVGGVDFHSQSFKRFSFNVLQPLVVNTPSNSVVEESCSEVLGELGVALESERVKDAPRHYSLRASMARLLWRRLDNTNAADRVFTGTKGWDLNLEGRYSMAIYELPSARLRSLSYGLELLWKL